MIIESGEMNHVVIIELDKINYDFLSGIQQYLPQNQQLLMQNSAISSAESLIIQLIYSEFLMQNFVRLPTVVNYVIVFLGFFSGQ